MPAISEIFAPQFFPVHAAFFFIMGAVFGSFFNVCIYRIPTSQNISVPGSYCYNCGCRIRWYDNIPIVSYLILRGRCRSCAVPFSIRYALIELLTGMLFLAVFVRYGYSWATLTYLIFTGLLLIATFTDVDLWIIPDRITKGGAVAGMLLALLLSFLPFQNTEAWIVAHAGPVPGSLWWAPVANSVVGAVVGSGLLYGIAVLGSLVFRQPAMGLGDVKLLIMIGAFTGWLIPILTIFAASFTGATYGLALIALQRLSDWRNRPKAHEKDQKPESQVKEMEALLDDTSPSAEKRGWLFSTEEKAVLARILADRPESPKRHHIIFGPHLAVSAWILMMYEKPVVDWLREYLGFY